MRFTGSFPRNLDAKGRLSLPANLRKQLPDRVCVMPAPDVDALYVFTEEAHGAWVDSVFESQDGGYDPTDPEHAQVREMLFAMAITLDIDSAARISIPEDYRSEKGLEREVTVVGNDDRLEIWDREKWEARRKASASMLSNFFSKSKK